MFGRKTLINEQIQDVALILPHAENISDSISRNWTDQAITCYYLEGNCQECSIGCGKYSFVCQMHKVVNKLLKEVGPPSNINEDKILSA